jgi:hypothetical protein
VHLGKPYLATPVKKQFEQVLNARYVETLNYGMNRAEPSEDDVRAFIKNLPRYNEGLASYDRQSNARTFEVLDGLMDQAAAGILGSRSLIDELLDNRS